MTSTKQYYKKGLNMSHRYDSAEDAIRCAILQSSKSMKEVACELWPSLKIESAYARLQNALNPEKSDKLTLDEIILICRLCKRADPLFYMASELRYQEPIQINPEEEKAELMKEFVSAQKYLQSVIEKMEKLKS